MGDNTTPLREIVWSRTTVDRMGLVSEGREATSQTRLQDCDSGQVTSIRHDSENKTVELKQRHVSRKFWVRFWCTLYHQNTNHPLHVVHGMCIPWTTPSHPVGTCNSRDIAPTGHMFSTTCHPRDGCSSHHVSTGCKTCPTGDVRTPLWFKHYFFMK